MSLKLKYNGRSFSNPRSMAAAMERDLKSHVERQLRQAASGAGAHVTKKANGDFEIKGTLDQMDRFNRRLGK